MDAHALLTSQGWRGKGHSLHPTNENVGLKRPLLVSRKDNTLGIGKKQHRTSDMWWMNAFDSSLKGLDTSKQGTVVQTVTSGGLDMIKMGGGKYVGTAVGKGLYASFVKGECLSGTITEDSKESTPTAVDSVKEQERRKRKSVRGSNETKEERRARKIAKRAARAKKALIEAEAEAEIARETSVEKIETKEERRERRRLKKLAKEAEKNYVELSSGQARKKKKRRKD
ncbi:hypothetical protein BJ875DRAFT_374299 [Amylocarpus encephaloides]|uniref:G-patch domain-containing protein n=1 Tax=Amylocarpus encephaloides TaxID=45428 RepID=A0A9P7YKT8_9HELO|nr:hypothetical protein BJ875DRAFT_374299 [Amylocarpus encephaloides]